MIELIGFRDEYLNKYVNNRIKNLLRSFIEDDVCATDLSDEIESSGIEYYEWIKANGTASILAKLELKIRKDPYDSDYFLVPENIRTNEEEIFEWLEAPVYEIERVLNSDIPEPLSIQSQSILKKIIDYMIISYWHDSNEECNEKWVSDSKDKYKLPLVQPPTTELLYHCLTYAINDYQLLSREDEETIVFYEDTYISKWDYIHERMMAYVTMFCDINEYLYSDEDPLIELEGDFYYE